jgi:hypothetical protein
MGKLLMGQGPFLGWPFDSGRELFALLVVAALLFLAFALISISLALLLEGLLRGVTALTRDERIRKRVIATFVNGSRSRGDDHTAQFDRPLPSRPLKASSYWRERTPSPAQKSIV